MQSKSHSLERDVRFYNVRYTAKAGAVSFEEALGDGLCIQRNGRAVVALNGDSISSQSLSRFLQFIGNLERESGCMAEPGALDIYLFRRVRDGVGQHTELLSARRSCM